MQQESLVVVAADLRRRARQFEAPFSTTKIVRECFPDAEVTGRNLPPKIDEIVTRTREGALIIYRRGMSTAEQRLAIAHGVCHLLFDTAEAACSVGRVGDPKCEERADRFAVELLVPLDHLARVVRRWPSAAENDEIYLDHVDQVAARFNVSAHVIDQRIRRLNRTTGLYG